MNSKEVTTQEAADLLSAADRILILCHMKPDGDTFGCGLPCCTACARWERQSVSPVLTVSAPGTVSYIGKF
jgi:nanoRNase/pAp phosphatase (c-di-AMP/oligoRNAs hydrolase)